MPGCTLPATAVVAHGRRFPANTHLASTHARVSVLSLPDAARGAYFHKPGEGMVRTPPSAKR